MRVTHLDQEIFLSQQKNLQEKILRLLLFLLSKYDRLDDLIEPKSKKFEIKNPIEMPSPSMPTSYNQTPS